MTEFIGRTKHVAKDIKQQITAATKANKAFTIQLDESTHIVKNAQCTVYVIQTAVEDMIENILFYSRFPTTKTGEDINTMVISAYNGEGLNWC